MDKKQKLESLPVNEVKLVIEGTFTLKTKFNKDSTNVKRALHRLLVVETTTNECNLHRLHLSVTEITVNGKKYTEGEKS